MKTIYFLFLMTLAPIIGLAQEGFMLGAGGGAYSSWIINQNSWGNPEMEYTSTIGYQFHGTLGYRVTENIGFQVEPGLTRAGQNYSGKMATLDSERKIQLTYITVPVFFHFISNGDLTRFHLLAGPQFAILNSANHNFSSALPFPYMPVGDLDVKDRFASSDVMAVLDVGADMFVADNMFVSAGLRFNYGFKDVNAPDWQMPNLQQVYEPSKNFFAGLNIGINYVFD